MVGSHTLVRVLLWLEGGQHVEECIHWPGQSVGTSERTGTIRNAPRTISDYCVGGSTAAMAIPNIEGVSGDGTGSDMDWERDPSETCPGSSSGEEMEVSQKEMDDILRDEVNLEDWVFEPLVVGDGTRGKGVIGKKLVQGELYASAKMTGSYENCHFIAPRSVVLALREEVGLSFPTLALDWKRVKHPKECRIRCETARLACGEGMV